jgi:hypothetical protein
MITPEIAWDIRLRGYLLPIKGKYSDEELLKIAIRQKELIEAMGKLDKKILEMIKKGE